MGYSVIIIAIVVLVVVAADVSSKKKARQERAYTRKPFMSTAERSFYGVLKQAVDGRAEVFSKVALKEFIKAVSDNKSEWRTL